MAIITSEAILLRKTELRETSFILNFFTRESGKIVGVIKGVRSPQPQFGALFEIFSLDKIVFYERKRGDVFTISQCELVDYFSGIRKDFKKVSYASYFMEMIDTIAVQGERNEEMFDVLIQALKSLERSQNPDDVKRVFELKILKINGLMPSLKECMICKDSDLSGSIRFSIKSGSVICPNCSAREYTVPISMDVIHFIDSMVSLPMNEVLDVDGSDVITKEVDGLIKNFINFHIQKRFKSVEFMGCI